MRYFIDLCATPCVKVYTVEGEFEAPKHWKEMTFEEYTEFIEEFDSYIPNAD